jgi:hypothetical protein
VNRQCQKQKQNALAMNHVVNKENQMIYARDLNSN